MAYIGDVDVQRIIPIGQTIYPDGVIEIARRLAIDGDDGHVAEIAPSFQLGGGDGVRNGLSLLQHFGRELMRQVMLADDDFDIHSEIAGAAQNLDHAAHWPRSLLGILQQFDVHDHAGEIFHRLHLHRSNADAVRPGGGRSAARKFHAIGNIDPLVDPAIGGNHVAAAAADFELTDHRGVGALQHLDDFAIGAPTGLDARNSDDHAVAVHGALGLFRRKEDIACDPLHRALGDQEAVAIAVHLQASHGEFAAARGDGVVAGAQLDEVAARGEPGQSGFEGRAAIALNAQLADQLLEIGPGVREAGDVVQKGRVVHSLILCDDRDLNTTPLAAASSLE